MSNYDDYIQSLTMLRNNLEESNAFRQNLGLPTDINKNATIGLDIMKTEMLLHIADEVKRIADSLEKMTSLSLYEDKGARKEEENKENDTK